jgi:hypothetical protein
LTPSIFVRIAPILLPAPQEKHPGTVNCTILSAAKAVNTCDITKISIKKRYVIFFITPPNYPLSTIHYLFIHYDKFPKVATAIYD